MTTFCIAFYESYLSTPGANCIKELGQGKVYSPPPKFVFIMTATEYIYIYRGFSIFPKRYLIYEQILR
jgi:hypothetical protein